mmetsp:Transcript_8695/g.20691  ORF Transcript_8695/g.20691 Transcript_8695/m.20691 type:complete len:170 (-) Transcript_8695:116-625(-)
MSGHKGAAGLGQAQKMAMRNNGASKSWSDDGDSFVCHGHGAVECSVVGFVDCGAAFLICCGRLSISLRWSCDGRGAADVPDDGHALTTCCDSAVGFCDSLLSDSGARHFSEAGVGGWRHRHGSRAPSTWMVRSRTLCPKAGLPQQAQPGSRACRCSNRPNLVNATALPC